MERLLVTGIDGPVGGNLALSWANRGQVLGLYGQQPLEAAGIRTAPCDLTHRTELAELVGDWQPRWIIHCGPLSASSWDDAPGAAVAEAEPHIVADLAEIASQASARLLVISSDIVFAGPRMFHEEGSPATAAAPRAEQTRAMERVLEQTTALIVRTHAYGWSGETTPTSFAQRAFEALCGGGPLPADGLRHATPILVTDLAELLLRAMELRLQGIYHLAGAERTSPFHFVSELAAACGLTLPRAERPTAAPCEGQDETSLNSKRARRALEMATPLLREGLDRFASQAHDGWRQRWQNVARRATLREFAA